MADAICPYCLENLYEAERIAKGEGKVNCLPGGFVGFVDKPEQSFAFAIITCSVCNKILGAVNTSPMPIPPSEVGRE